MKSRITTVAIALALVGAFAAPASAAQAASATVSGTVEYEGTPIRGVVVGWFKPSTGTFKTATSGSDGGYSLELPGSGQKYVLFANLDMTNTKQTRVKKNYVGVFYGDGDERDFAYQTVDPYTASATADAVDIELAKPGSIFGTDYHLKNQPVELQTLGGTTVDSSIDDQGNMDFSNLVPGKYRVVTNIDYDYGYGVTDEVLTVESGEDTRFDAGVFSGGYISGTATNSSGKPAAGVEVTLTPTFSGSDPDHTTTDVTDSKGKYSFRHLHGSSYDVTFSRAGNTSNQKTGDRGYLAETEEITGITETSKIVHDVTLATGGRVRGEFASTSKDSENTITLLNANGTVINGDYYYPVDGKFTFGSLKSGRYTAYFTNHVGSKYEKKSFTVTAGKTTDLGTIKRTSKGVSLSGTVSNFDPAFASYYSSVQATKVGGPNYYAYIDKHGKYSLKGLVPGTYTVRVFVEGREDKGYTVSVTSNTNKTLAVGTKWGTVKAKLTVDGSVIPKGVLSLGERYNFWSGQFSKGAWSITAPAGSYGRIGWFSTTAVFQGKSPYWLTLPDDTLPVTIKAGTTKDLGTIALAAH